MTEGIEHPVMNDSVASHKIGQVVWWITNLVQHCHTCNHRLENTIRAVWKGKINQIEILHTEGHNGCACGPEAKCLCRAPEPKTTTSYWVRPINKDGTFQHQINVTALALYHTQEAADLALESS